MCLHYSPQATAALRRKMKVTGRIVAYKELRVADTTDTLVSWYTRCAIWKPGWVVSNRRAESEEPPIISGSPVDRGIHVYVQPPKNTTRCLVVVPVTCHLRDLVAADGANAEPPTAVFRKVFFKKRDYEAAMTEVVERRKEP